MPALAPNSEEDKIIKRSVITLSLIILGWFSRKAENLIARKIVLRVFKGFYYWRDIKVLITTQLGFKMILNIRDSVDEKIFLTGRWEPAITHAVRSKLKNGSIFIDVGANIGYYSLLASSIVGSEGKVYAFEASPSIYERLCENINLNDCKNISVINKAICASNSQVTIYKAGLHNTGHSTIIDQLASNENMIREGKVEGITLSSAMSDADLSRLSAVKIDVEGEERLVIEGCTELIHRKDINAAWFIELSPDFMPGKQADVDFVYSFFTNAGFSAYQIPNSYSSDYWLRSTYELENFSMTKLESPPTNHLTDLMFIRL
jgi:FkbM family methyltransferase